MAIDIKITPNPAENSHSLFFSLQEPDEIVIELFDVQGRFISKVFNAKTKEGAIEREISNLVPGMYFYKFQSSSGLNTMIKFIKI